MLDFKIMEIKSINDFENQIEYRRYMKKRRTQITNYLYRNNLYLNSNGDIIKSCTLEKPS